MGAAENLFAAENWAQIGADWGVAFCAAFGFVDAVYPRAVLDTVWGRQAAQVIAVVLQGATHHDLDYTYRLLIAHDLDGLRGCVKPDTYAAAVTDGLRAMPADVRSTIIETACWLLGRVVGP